MSHATITYIVLGAAVVAFMVDRVPVAVVAMGVAVALWATGVLPYQDVLRGFGDPAVVLIASLFVVSEGLDATGVTAWMGQALIARAGASRTRLLVLLVVLAAGFTALINPNGSVSALLPVVVVIAVRLRHNPAQLLLPLAFAAHAGSLLALTGSPVNVIVSEASADAGDGAFGFWSFGLVGLPLVAATLAVILVFGERLLPQRRPRAMPADFGRHAATLVEHYALAQPPERLLTRDEGAAEVVIPPRSPLIGETAFAGMTTDSGELVILAVQRDERPVEGATTLQAGDQLLLRGPWAKLDEHLEAPEVVLVDEPGQVRRQAVPLGRGAKRAIAVLVAMVIVMATGAIPTAMAGLLAAGTLVVLGVVSIDHAYRAVSWTTVLLVAGMLPLSAAMVQTGAADQLAGRLLDVVGDASPHLLLAAIVVVTAVLGQLISNTATALVVIPVAVSAAADLDVSTRPLLMGIAVAAAASFLTPVATPANLMVMGPGGYRFGDYWKLGLPLLALFAAAAILLVPVIWSF
jgi:di/tricarboxylate transporter